MAALTRTLRCIASTSKALASAPSARVAVARTFSTSLRSRMDEPEPALLNSLNNLTEEEQALKEAVIKFGEDVLTPDKVRKMDEAEQMDPDVVQALFEAGLFGIESAPEYGGSGMSFTASIVAIEELAKKDAAVSAMVDVHSTLIQRLMRVYGTDAQKEKFIPALSTKTVGSFCLSEPASGSDAFALKTRAEKTKDGYVINGSKMWITNSKEADFFLVFANLDPSKGYKGISCFIVNRSDGLEVAKKEQKLGLKASSTCTVNFDNVKIPHDQLLGEEGQGYKYAIESLNEGRIGIGAQMVGIAKGAFEKAVPYCYQRKQFGKLVGDFQAMGHQFADIYLQIEAARLLVYNAARMKEEGQNFVVEAAMAKMAASQVAKRASEKAIEWGGGVGFTRETGIEKYYRDAMIGSIYEGTSNIQLETIAKHIRKLYA